MKLYSMTATFGKLEHETLTLQPGLNVIQAPNEWGKSTWCAFLVAMLYGIETRVHTTRAALADKERYAPWSGSPMSGRIDLNWEGRDITIERSSRGRSVFGVFRAYETHTGLEIPELRADNCGQLLLGVEKSVFTRAGFLRLADLPVTQDEALRRRLNALVTTGDESGTADALAQKLRDLKNRCRANRSNGLLPQAQQQRSDLEAKLAELQALRGQSETLIRRQQELEEFHRRLENHKAALAYEENRAYAQKLRAAEQSLTEAGLRLRLQEEACGALPEADRVERSLLRLDQLSSARDALQLEVQLLPEAPQLPEVPNAFRELPAEDAVSCAQADAERYAQSCREQAQKGMLIAGVLVALLSLGLLLIPHWAGILGAALGVLAGFVLCGVQAVNRRRARAAAHGLEARYHPLEAHSWVEAAGDYARQQEAYRAALAQYQVDRADLTDRAQKLKQEMEAATQGRSLAQCRQIYDDARQQWKALGEARREYCRAGDLVQTLRGSQQEAAPPAFPDDLTHSMGDTQRLLSDCSYEQRQLHEKLGRCQGRMEALGSQETLQKQLDAVNCRIAALEDTCAALELAQDTLAKATAELQRRFAPRISQRAQALFGKLTDGRYTRLTLGDDLTVHAGAAEEDILHTALWRSDGTVDQLYLALRLAVAEELTPQAPLILDDALVRFDDVRLAEAVDLLLEAADSRQVILFTCQSREKALLETMAK